MVPPGVRLGIVRSISYGLFGKPDAFVPQLRELGAGLVRVYFYWSQVEPEPGRFSFDAVDAFLDQLDGSEEVCNVGLLWAGTAAQYVAQLEVLHRAVKDADPGAAVVLGGAPYGLPASDPDDPDRQFFDVLLRDGRDFLRPVRPAPVRGDRPDPGRHRHRARDDAGVRLREAAGGRRVQRPLAEPVPRGGRGDGEGAGGGRLAGGRHRPPVRAHGQPATAAPDVHAGLPAGAGGQARPDQPPGDRHAQPAGAVGRGAPDSVLESGAGHPGYEDPPSPMDLLFGKLALLGYEGTELRLRHPSAEAFSLLAERLAGVERVTRVEVPGRPSLQVFGVRRRERGPLLVVRRDPFTGEDEPPAAFAWAWPAARASAVDALGRAQPVELRDGRVELQVSVTPLFVAAD
jgi:hypothetical protein